MKRMIKFEWDRMIHSKTLLISLIISYAIIVADVFAWYKLYRDGIDVYTSIFYKWLGVNRGMNAGIYFFMALPLLTALQALHIKGEVITTPYSFVATTHSIW